MNLTFYTLVHVIVSEWPRRLAFVVLSDSCVIFACEVLLWNHWLKMVMFSSVLWNCMHPLMLYLETWLRKKYEGKGGRGGNCMLTEIWFNVSPGITWDETLYGGLVIYSFIKMTSKKIVIFTSLRMTGGGGVDCPVLHDWLRPYCRIHVHIITILNSWWACIILTW